MIEEYILNTNVKKSNVVQELEWHYIHIKYSPDTNELLYEFFNKQETDSKYNFIWSIVYFLK